MADLQHIHEEYFKQDFLKNEISKSDSFERVADIFSLLADPTRLKIYWLLCHSKECVTSISEMMAMTNPAVSHHLKILKDAELIESYRDGKEVYYTANPCVKTKQLHESIENLMSITCPDFDCEHEQINENSEFLEDQVAKIKQVHDYLTQNLSKRITIEELARQFAMNPTTLKTVFKDVYGTAIATHIKDHRMEKAAKLLLQTDMSIAQVAGEVGYESQSKFSAVFKDSFGQTPVEYKKNKR